jgi:hypothetical protein
MHFMNDMSTGAMRQVERDDFWTEHDEAIQEHYFYGSEGKNIGTALGFLSLGAALACTAGLVVAAVVMRS